MEPKAREIFLSGIKELGLRLSQTQFKQFDMYLHNLKFFNRKINLTKITDDEAIVIKHFLDSLALFKSNLVKAEQQIVDVGAGAGFPGIPLKIIQPHTALFLVESNNKKALFLDIITKKLGLTTVSIINDRVESFGQGLGRGKFDLAVARAVSKLAVLLEYVIPLLKKEAHFIALKARVSNEELAGGRKACTILNCEIEEPKFIRVPFLDAERSLLVAKKNWGTPKQYPRRPGLPARKPLS